MSDPTPDPILSAQQVARVRKVLALPLDNPIEQTWAENVCDVVESHEALRAERDNLALTVEEDAIYLRTAEAALVVQTRRADEAERAKADLIAAYDAQFTAKLRDQMAAARAVLAAAPNPTTEPICETCGWRGGQGSVAEWTNPGGYRMGPCPSCTDKEYPA